MNLPCSGAAAGGLVASIWIKPNLLDSTAAETVAGDDLNIIISVRPASVANDDMRAAARVVVGQDSSGRLYYDVLVEPPKEKAMLDSIGCSPDHYSGHWLNVSVEHDAKSAQQFGIDPLGFQHYRQAMTP